MTLTSGFHACMGHVHLHLPEYITHPPVCMHMQGRHLYIYPHVGESLYRVEDTVTVTVAMAECLLSIVKL